MERKNTYRSLTQPEIHSNKDTEEDNTSVRVDNFKPAQQ